MVNSVTVQIKGGLGNQLFQYYAGVYLSNFTQKSLILNFPLNHKSFQIHGALITEFNLTQSSITYNPLKSPKVSDRLSSFLLNSEIPLIRSRYPKNSYFVEGKAKLLDVCKDLRGEIILDGYFQSNEIVDNALNLVPSIFEDFDKKLPENLKELNDKIRDNRGIVVHVRRGDYRNLTNSIGMLGPTYYAQALSELEMYNVSAEIYVFSDEILQTRRELGNLFPKSTNWVGLENYISPSESLYLMSNASTLIIGNSTFAWWAAKLSKTQSNVFFPSQWRKDGKNIGKLIPDNWLKIDAQFL